MVREALSEAPIQRFFRLSYEALGRNYLAILRGIRRGADTEGDIHYLPRPAPVPMETPTWARVILKSFTPVIHDQEFVRQRKFYPIWLLERKRVNSLSSI